MVPRWISGHSGGCALSWPMPSSKSTLKYAVKGDLLRKHDWKSLAKIIRLEDLLSRMSFYQYLRSETKPYFAWVLTLLVSTSRRDKPLAKVIFLAFIPGRFTRVAEPLSYRLNPARLEIPTSKEKMTSVLGFLQAVEPHFFVSSESVITNSPCFLISSAKRSRKRIHFVRGD